jgi:hypothetical protein
LRRMTRAEALAAVVDIIAKSVSDLPLLIALLDIAGQRLLAARLREVVTSRPAEVGGKARPDPGMWRRGQL